jgi:uncharacterized protein
LAGRIAYLELPPLSVAEVGPPAGEALWLRGGFPDSMTASSHARSLQWRLMPWHANVGKRLVKSPKVYVRDSGLVHALLGIESMDNLLSHPVVGASWEGFVLENLLACAPIGTQAHFYRTSGGAEVDVLLSLPSGELWALEVKRGLQPKVERGFYAACEDLQPARKLVVYPGTEAFPMAHGVKAVPLADLCGTLSSMCALA